MERIGLLAGGGDLPKVLAQELYNRQVPFVIVFFEDISHPSGYPKVLQETFRLGQIGAILKYLKTQDIKKILPIGYFQRPTLKQMIPDLKGAAWLAKLMMKVGDDDYLRCLLELIENEGFRVVNPEECIKDALIVPAGTHTKVKPKAAHFESFKRGSFVLQCLSSADVAQAIVVDKEKVLGIEAAEGTFELIKRCGKYEHTKDSVVVKLSKKNQDLRMDRPAIGPDTISAISSAGFAGIFIEANLTFMIHKDLTIQIANEHKLFIHAVDQEKV